MTDTTNRKAVNEAFSDGWVDEKPSFNSDCLLITAVLIRGQWEYNIWIIKEFNGYMAWLCGDGEEYGDLNDLKAHKYKILPLLNNTQSP